MNNPIHGPHNGLSQKLTCSRAAVTVQTAVLYTMCTLLLPGGASAQQWAQTEPAPRTFASSVYIPAVDQMVVFGGNNDVQDFNDVWRLNRASTIPSYWVPLTPTGTRPAARAGHTAVYDAASDRMIVFGGGLGFSSPCSNETWVLSNASGVSGAPTWTELSPAGSPPAPRINHTAVYDAASNRMIVFGGLDCFSTYYNDTWILTNANGVGGTPTWTELSPGGTLPAGRERHTATYDPSVSAMTVYGGTTTPGEISDELWVLSSANGVNGAASWRQLVPQGPTPGGRGTHTAVFDVASNRMIVFGGVTSANTLSAQIWILSGANGAGGTSQWSLLAPGGTQPFATANHAAVYSQTNHRMITFGGNTMVPGGETDFSNSLWILTKAAGF